MSKEPYMPLYMGDLLASTSEWSGEERALYLLLLAHQWALGSLPADPERIRYLSGYSPENFFPLWKTVEKKFSAVDKRLVNKRLEEHRDKQQKLLKSMSDGGKRAMEKRWGNRRVVRDKPLIGPLITPIQSSYLEKEEEKKDKPLTNYLISPLSAKTSRNLDSANRRGESGRLQPPQGINVDAWNEWTNYRKSIGKALKPPNYSRTWEKMLSFGDSTAQQAAVAHSIADGYIGLFAPKPNYQPKANGKPVVSDAERDRTMATLAERATLIGFRQPTPADDVVAYEALVRRAEDSHWTAKRLAELTTKGKA